MQLFPYKILLLSVVLTAGIIGCKKDYLTDGGVHNPVTPLSTYDYLAANQYQQFDTVLLLIDHFGLRDSVNRAGTFFAPTDYNIRHILIDQKFQTLDSLYTQATSKMLTQFMFTDTSLSLYNAPLITQTFANWADTTAGIRRLAQSYFSVTSTFVYYRLQYIKINGYLDGTPGVPAEDRTDFVLNCQTTGIKTSSGANTLHVLDNSAPIAVK